MAVDAKGDPVISYWDESNEDLKFAICNLSASANGNCDQSGDWNLATVDAEGQVGHNPSIATDTDGDLMISYYDWTKQDLKFAICDLSASADGNCDQSGDWNLATVDAEGAVGWTTSIAVNAEGDPVISYYDATNTDLRFAICDLSASANGNCDQSGDWNLATVDAEGEVGHNPSIAIDTEGDLMISYYDWTNQDLKFAICDPLASANGNCNQSGDWNLATVDAEGQVGRFISLAVDAQGDPAISYWDQTNGNLKLAICDVPESANGDCDQTSDWSTMTVDAEETVGVWTSIAARGDGDLMISYWDQTRGDLKFAICDASESANGECDQPGDWSVETVDVAGDVGRFSSIAVGIDGNPMISYHDLTNADLKFAIASAAPPPTPAPTAASTLTPTPVPSDTASVGGTGESPDVAGPASGSDLSAGRYALLAVLAAVAVSTLTAGAWYARRRWLR